jgi:hypothetical protein
MWLFFLYKVKLTACYYERDQKPLSCNKEKTMPLFPPRTRASLVHQTVTTVHGGPHVGSDSFARTNKISEPVVLTDRKARLTCELEHCNCTYDLYVLPRKTRLKIAARRFLIIAMVLATGSLMAQAGTWAYDAGMNSQALRVLGDILVSAGVGMNLLLLLFLLMSFWFWPPRYELSPIVSAEEDGNTKASVAARYSDTRTRHAVNLVA